MIGKLIRLERIIDRNTKKTIIVPMDHGITIGPCKGIVDMKKTIDLVAQGGANAVLGHVGMPLHAHRKGGKDIGLILHLSSSTSLGPDPNKKILTGSVEQAIKFGADGVSVHINIGSKDEPEMLKDLGYVSRKCIEWGMPLIAMMYPRGPNIKNSYDVTVVKHSVRIAAELGADIIKTNYTGSIESFREVVDGALGVPVIIAGGAKGEDEKTLQMIKNAMKAGASGVAIGRNAFEHKNPEKIIRAVYEIIYNDANCKDAINILS
ncbi:MAG: fructose-bisphosphate aldolase [Candidatus Aenigmarchaeota archaeon ex4484_52]|nr:MAG: fructose-bisphosphate aldolase [Candidatus Aenigmarchaeota archaeon ex4484_52]